MLHFSNKKKKWLKKVGLAGFLFFLIKGLAWLAFIFWLWIAVD